MLPTTKISQLTNYFLNLHFSNSLLTNMLCVKSQDYNIFCLTSFQQLYPLGTLLVLIDNIPQVHNTLPTVEL